MTDDWGRLLAGAAALSVLHAAIPNHWVPLAVLGRSGGWSRGRLAMLAGAAALAHVASTVLVGLAVGALGLTIAGLGTGVWRFVAPGLLAALGVFWIVLDLRGTPHAHAHPHVHVAQEHLHCPPEHGGEVDAHGHRHRSPESVMHVGTLGGLLLAMFLSPCLELEAYYLSAAQLGWRGLAAVSGVYLVLVTALMMAFTVAAASGLARVRSHFLEHHERLVTGVVLLVFGALGLAGMH